MCAYAIEPGGQKQDKISGSMRLMIYCPVMAETLHPLSRLEAFRGSRLC